eukprot:gene51538-63024_t
MAPRLSRPHNTACGASAFGRKRAKPLMVGVHSGVMPRACASKPASQWLAASDKVYRASSTVVSGAGVSRTQALRPVFRSTSDWCRCPPSANIMSSGWHLPQSLVDARTGANVFRRDAPAPGSTAADAGNTLSEVGERYLAGLLAHARAMAVFCTPTVNGFGRFRPNALAPQSVLWGRDNRGAMLRVVGECADAATRIENRIGEPAANPYLYLASQIHAGLDGMARQLKAPPATTAPYGDADVRLPTSLGEALEALQGDSTLVEAFGSQHPAHQEQAQDGRQV